MIATCVKLNTVLPKPCSVSDLFCQQSKNFFVWLPWYILAASTFLMREYTSEALHGVVGTSLSKVQCVRLTGIFRTHSNQLSSSPMLRVNWIWACDASGSTRSLERTSGWDEAKICDSGKDSDLRRVWRELTDVACPSRYKLRGRETVRDATRTVTRHHGVETTRDTFLSVWLSVWGAVCTKTPISYAPHSCDDCCLNFLLPITHLIQVTLLHYLHFEIHAQNFMLIQNNK